MGDIVYLKDPGFNDALDNFVELFMSGQVSHAVIAYRQTDGELIMAACGSENLTYLIGMIERAKQEMLKEW